MGKILIKRAFRDLKAGAARYIALSFLIIFSIFIVISLMGAAVTVIDYTEIRDRELKCEDGEFTVFVPLTEEQREAVTSRGVTLEEMFFVDYPLEGDRVLRVFKVRDELNRISLIEGELPSSDNEAVIERRFAEVNGISVGDDIDVAGQILTISGIGATPDYNCVYRKVSDNVVDSKSFGTVFVTPARYDEMLGSGTSIATEEYCYAYLLNGAMTDTELKEILKENEFNAEDAADEYFLEYWERMTERKDELLEGIDELNDGASELADGAEELYDGINEFNDGMTELSDSMPDLSDGVDELNDGASELASGIREYTDGVDEAADGASELSSGASELSSGASSLEDGLGEYGAGLTAFSQTISAMTLSEDPYQAAIAGGLSDPASQLVAGFDTVSQGAGALSDGADALSDGADQLSDGLDLLSDNSDALVSGANALRDGTGELVDAVGELSDGVSELSDGSEEILDGAQELSDGAGELADGVSDFSDEANDLIDDVFNIKTENLMMFLTADENPRIDAAADDVEINLSASIIAGILLVMLFAYVISVFIVHTIDSESAVIGALYSMGVRRSTLTLSYVAVPVIVCALSGVAGTVIALFTPIGIPAQLMDTMGYYSMPALSIKITPMLVIYGLVIPPVTAFIVNFLVIRNRLKRTPLSLLRNERKVARGRDIKIRGLKFLDMFRLRQMLREMRSGITVVLGMFMSLLIAFLALNTYVYCDNVKKEFVSGTKYEYMYNYKYPTEEVPEGGYEAVVESFKKDIYGYTFDVSIMGITEDNPFFDTGDLPKDTTNVVISSAVAVKYCLSEGDEFTLRSESGDRLYAFRVSDVIDYSASLAVFMDIDQCRDLFDEDDEYFNAVFSDHELDIETGRLYSVISKSDIEKSAGIYVDMMGPMVTVMSVAAAVIFLVVMYLMLKMMLDRSSFNISLVKIFGFRNREVRQMYLDGNFYIVAVGALISIPLCKRIMDYLYPRYLVSNVAVGVSPTYPTAMYVVIFLVIIALYFVINFALMARIRKIEPAEVLKNRE